jgi:hypothetical protein
MWKRELLQAELLHRPLVGAMFFFCEPGVAGAASAGRTGGVRCR